VVTVSKRREVVEFFKSQHRLSERASCALVGLHRSTCQYESVREDDVELIERIRALASERPRYGYRRIHALLRREGRVVNRKLVYRLYKAAGLAVRRRSRRRRERRASFVSHVRCR
jgi:putative transposase